MNPSLISTPNIRVPANPFHPEDRLRRALDARLTASPKVVAFHQIWREDTMPSGAHSGAIGRAVRLSDRVLTVVAIPDGIDRPSRFRHILGERWKRTNVLVVTEGWICRQPHLDGATAISDCSGHPVPVSARILLVQHLMEQGGGSYLSDCAARVPGSADPVRAVLALAASKVVTVDISRPLTSLTLVSLPSRRLSDGRTVMGG